MVAHTQAHDAVTRGAGDAESREDVERTLLDLVATLVELVGSQGRTIDHLGLRLTRLELLQATRGELDLLAKAGRP